MLKIIYNSPSSELADKKKNKQIAEAAKLSIKELGSIEVYSSMYNSVVGKIANAETIVPGWFGVDFETEDEIEPNAYKKGCLAQEIVFGKIYDQKHDAYFEGIERIVI
jgi:hypothetical protein